jgi:hypothetical protein
MKYDGRRAGTPKTSPAACSFALNCIKEKNKMKTLIARLLLVLSLTAIAAFAADVTGKWVGQVPGRDGQTRETTLNLKSDGSNVTGTISGRGGDTEIKEGKLTGDDLTFVVVRNFNGNEMKMNYKGKVAGNEIKFSYSMGERTVEFVAKKQ